MSSDYENAQICSEKLAQGAEVEDVPECRSAAIGYAQAAKTCVNEGFDSSECKKELLTESAKGAAIAYGVDPSVVDAAEECIESGGDSEICAKAGAKLAATAACMVVTEGAGGPLCAKLAPFVVDAIWPIAGPALVATWDVAWGFTSGVFEGLADFAQAMLNVAGIDLSTDADPTVTEIYWNLLGMGRQTLVEQWALAVEAVAAADRQSRVELGLVRFEIPRPAVFPDSTGVVNGADVKAEDFLGDLNPEAVNELERWLRQEPMWVDPIYLVLRSNPQVPPASGPWGTVPSGMASSNYAFEVHSSPVANKDMGAGDKRVNLGGMDPNMKKLTVGSLQYIPGSYEIEEGEGWTPWGFTWNRFDNQRKLLSDAYIAGLGIRLEGLKNATTNAVGSIVAQNTSKADASRRADMLKKVKVGEKEGSLAAPIIVGSLIAGCVLGYRQWKKSKG